MKTLLEKEEKHLDKIISFNQKEIKKMRKIGDTKKEMQHFQALEMARELKRNIRL